MLWSSFPPQVFQERHGIEGHGTRLHQQKEQQHILALVASVEKLGDYVGSPGRDRGMGRRGDEEISRKYATAEAFYAHNVVVNWKDQCWKLKTGGGES